MEEKPSKKRKKMESLSEKRRSIRLARDYLDFPVHNLPRPMDQMGGYQTLRKHVMSTTSIHAHLIRLHDVFVHLMSLPPSMETSARLVRAWRALCQSRSFDIVALWRYGFKVIERTRLAALLAAQQEEAEGDDDDPWKEDIILQHRQKVRQEEARRIDWARACREKTVDQVDKFYEYILALVASGQTETALRELNDFLPLRPYDDSIKLYVLAGCLSVLSCQPESHTNNSNRASSSDTDSSDGDGVLLDRNGTKKVAGVYRLRSRKRVRRESKDGNSRGDSDDDIIEFIDDDDYSTKKKRFVRDQLKRCSRQNPSLFYQAKEHFTRAARLEESNPEVSRSEGSRWLALLEMKESGGDETDDEGDY